MSLTLSPFIYLLTLVAVSVGLCCLFLCLSFVSQHYIVHFRLPAPLSLFVPLYFSRSMGGSLHLSPRCWWVCPPIAALSFFLSIHVSPSMAALSCLSLCFRSFAFLALLSRRFGGCFRRLPPHSWRMVFTGLPL